MTSCFYSAKSKCSGVTRQLRTGLRPGNRHYKQIICRGSGLCCLLYLVCLQIGDVNLSQFAVAPLTGSVDRNVIAVAQLFGLDMSLPSRGAWIEIIIFRKIAHSSFSVAPLTGSVDRNSRKMWKSCPATSLPSRGAWIEMVQRHSLSMRPTVAPLTGSVDRNLCPETSYLSPTRSLPSRGAWIEM